MKNIWTLPVIVAFGLALAAGSAFGQDQVQAVRVAIDAPQSAVVTVTAPTMSISGTASAGAGLARVTWQTSNGVTGTASGTGTWEASGIPVAEGTTTIVLRAWDVKGASSWVALVAVRQAGNQPAVISSAAKLQRPPAL